MDYQLKQLMKNQKQIHDIEQLGENMKSPFLLVLISGIVLNSQSS